MPPVDSEKQRAFAVEVVRRLREHAFEAYWAGGCVRDQLLGKRRRTSTWPRRRGPAEIREIFGTTAHRASG